MHEPTAFCRAVMHEYERQWSRASGHGVRHPLRLKIERLKGWCDESCSAADFESRLLEAERSDDDGLALLAEELLPLWRTVRRGGSLPFESA
jgi:hypothetical protein